MLTGFQQYLVEKGFKRTCSAINSKQETENYTSTMVSTYGPLQYNFKKGNIWVWWGLSEMGKPPVTTD